jgi:hypothetical protein
LKVGFNNLIKMSSYDGKVHIGVGLYLGYVVAWLGNYSTFLAAAMAFGIVSYYTTERFHMFINRIASMFYDRVVAKSIERIINDAASYGVSNVITTSLMFVLTSIRYLLLPRTQTNESFATIYTTSQPVINIEDNDRKEKMHLEEVPNDSSDSLMQLATQDPSTVRPKPPMIIIHRKR